MGLEGVLEEAGGMEYGYHHNRFITFFWMIHKASGVLARPRALIEMTNCSKV